MSTFVEVLGARANDEHVGLVFEGEAWSWAQIVQESVDRAALINRFSSEGERPHIGVLLENVPDYIFWIGAASLAGAVIVGINSTRRGAQLAHDISHTDCDILITDNNLAPLLEGVAHGIPADRVLNIDEPSYVETLAKVRGSVPPQEVPSPDEILFLLFSSGSTGTPKAVICSHGRYGRLAQILTERTAMRRDSVTYLSMPLFHGNSAMLNFAPAANVGATIVLARKFSASGFIRDIHRHGVTFVNYVGRALSYVLEQPESERDRNSSLELAVGTEASAADSIRFMERFNCVVSESYGSSEGVVRIGRTPDSPTDALGMPVAGVDVRIIDEGTGRECAPAELDEHGRLRNSAEAVGQIVGKGLAANFEGYYKNPAAHAERVRGGDFWTGDLGYRDSAGFFYFAGRSSDWLRVDSENFSAAPVERVLERWEKLASAVVYAVPDPRTGDQVMCSLQMRDGSEFDPVAFAAYLDRQPDMGTKWRPRFVRVVERMPTTGNNKVAREVLRQAGWQTSDRIFWRADREPSYRVFDQEAKAKLEEEFAVNRRLALLPQR